MQTFARHQVVKPARVCTTGRIERKLWSWRGRYGAPFVSGNRVRLLIDGGPFFASLIEAIEGAKRYVYLETYILAADNTGWRVAKALAEKARAGVEVALSYD